MAMESQVASKASGVKPAPDGSPSARRPPASVQRPTTFRWSAHVT